MLHDLEFARARRGTPLPYLPVGPSPIVDKDLRSRLVRMTLAMRRQAPANDNAEDLRRRLLGAEPILTKVAIAVALLAFLAIPGRFLAALATGGN